MANKSDLPATWTLPEADPVSARTGEGLDGLRQRILTVLTGHEPLHDDVLLSNARHISLLRGARSALVRGRDAIVTGATEEFVLADLHAARAQLAEVVGPGASADVLNRIFERFCVGK